jgi:cytidylate kinase
VEERARRRATQTGESYKSVLAAMQRRDRLDSSRAVAPMARAEDAVALETDELPLEDAICEIVRLARQRGA